MADPAPLTPPFSVKKKRPHLGRNMLWNAPIEALDVSGTFKKVAVPPAVCIMLSIFGLATVIRIQNVLLGSGRAGQLPIRVAALSTT